MQRRKEPEFMIELHKIREKLSKKWAKASLKDMLGSLHESAIWLKSQLRSTLVK